MNIYKAIRYYPIHRRNNFFKDIFFTLKDNVTTFYNWRKLKNRVLSKVPEIDSMHTHSQKYIEDSEFLSSNIFKASSIFNDRWNLAMMIGIEYHCSKIKPSVLHVTSTIFPKEINYTIIVCKMNKQTLMFDNVKHEIYIAGMGDIAKDILDKHSNDEELGKYEKYFLPLAVAFRMQLYKPPEDYK